MGKIILIVLLSIAPLKWQNPVAVEGKWRVDNVDISTMKQKMTPQQIEAVNSLLVKSLTNAVFEFKADHHFYLSPALPQMPKNDSWEYDAANKVITVREYDNSKGVIMKIIMSKKDGMTFFSISQSPIVLKVHKL